MKMLRKVALLLLILGCRYDTSNAITEATICTVTKNPSKFDGKRLIISASIVNHGGLDQAILVDASCPDVAFKLVPARKDVDASVKKLQERLTSGGHLPSTLGRDVTGNFTGRFRMSRGPVKRFTFELEHIQDLKISRSSELIEESWASRPSTSRLQ